MDTDRFAVAMMTYRNTPDRDTKLSPSQVLYARQLRDAVPVNPKNLQLRKDWVLTKEMRERALAVRHQVSGEAWAEKSRELAPLTVGQSVQVQNQTGPNSNKWDLSGRIVEVQDF